MWRCWKNLWQVKTRASYVPRTLSFVVVWLRSYAPERIAAVNSVVKQKVRIGNEVTVGLGSVVAGIPAKQLKQK